MDNTHLQLAAMAEMVRLRLIHGELTDEFNPEYASSECVTNNTHCQIGHSIRVCDYSALVDT